MSRRKRTPRTPRAMKIDYNRDLDSLLNQSVAKLDENLANMDDRLDVAMGDMDQKLEKAMAAVKKVTAHSPYVPLKTKVASKGGVTISMGSKAPRKHTFTFMSASNNRVTVNYNSENDYTIRTDGDLKFDMDFMTEIQQRIIDDVADSLVLRKNFGGVPDHVLKAARQISDMERGTRKKKTITLSDRYMMEDPGPVENIWSEDMFGNLKQPISESLRMDTKVRVSSRPGLSGLFLPHHPKYQIFVGDMEVHMRKMEDMMYRSSLMGSGDNGGIFVESWLKQWTDEEVYFLREAMKGVVALRLNRKYHDETLSVLDKRLSKQCDGDGDVGDSVGVDGGS